MGCQYTLDHFKVSVLYSLVGQRTILWMAMEMQETLMARKSEGTNVAHTYIIITPPLETSI